MRCWISVRNTAAEGFRATLIEREAEYVADIQRRLFEGDAGPFDHATAVAIGLVRPRE